MSLVSLTSLAAIMASSVRCTTLTAASAIAMKLPSQQEGSFRFGGPAMQTDLSQEGLQLMLPQRLSRQHLHCNLLDVIQNRLEDRPKGSCKAHVAVTVLPQAGMATS